MFLYILNLIPIVIFGGALIAVFILFIFGSFIFLFAENKERGREIIIKSLFWLVIILMMFFAFTGMTYLVKKGNIFNPQQVTGEFPLSPAGVLPPPPIIK